MIEMKEMTEFSVACRWCRKEVQITANETDICHWQDGVYIQDALPYLSAAERELLISGTCDACWHKMFPEPEE